MTNNQNITILVVEDEQALNNAYQIILRTAGYKALAAYDGQEGLDVAEKNSPDLILLDLRMPHMDGLEFLRRYSPAKKHPNVKIIVFSNYDMQKEIDEAYKLGAERYILKAWASPKELLRVITDTLNA